MASKAPYIIGGLAGLGALLLFAGKAKADDFEDDFDEDKEKGDVEDDVTEEEEKDWPDKDRFPNPKAVENEFRALGYSGGYGEMAGQFQRDVRVPSANALFGSKQSDYVDRIVGVRTLKLLGQAQRARQRGTWPDTAAKDGWKAGESMITLWPGMGGKPSFFTALQQMGYQVMKGTPEKATIDFQRDVKAFFNATDIRTDGLVDDVTMAWLLTATQDPNFHPGLYMES